MKEPKYLWYNQEDASGNMPDELLDQVLKSDNMMPLPDDFADRVAGKAIKRHILKQSLSEFFVYFGAILLAAIIFCAVFYFTSPEAWSRWGDVLLPRWNLIVGVAVTWGFVFFADRVILPWLFFQPPRHEGTKRTRRGLFPL
jgi:hypothetical protein